MTDKKENIILIGMAGAGKSTLGVLLAKALGKDFLDTDIVIQQRSGRLLQEVIDVEGIGPFLELEEDVLSHLQARGCVIATGGSAVYSEKAMEALGQNGLIVYLQVSYEEICRRLKDISTRGIVLKHGNSLRDAYDERIPLYNKFSDITVDCTGKGIEQSVAEIISRL
jgi:shikimate kinase